jgi:tetratricopeptide (TPR) repeat protein
MDASILERLDPNALNLLVGVLYLLVFGLVGLLRREPLTAQFALEVLGLTLFAAAGGYLTGSAAHPILFVAFLYLVSMRARLLVDLANLLSNRGRQRDALSILQVAQRMAPDRPARLIILSTMGMVQIRRKNPASARDLLQHVLQEDERRGGLGPVTRAACHYHLALALRRLGEEAAAVKHFNEAIDILPGSPHARAARQALQKGRKEGRRS